LIVFMRLPQWLARFNRYFTNPIQRMWAGWAPTMGILEYVGRKSGKPYRVHAADRVQHRRSGCSLTYGPNRDWLKNVVSAGGGRMRRYGKTLELTDPRVMPKAQAGPAEKGLWRPIFARLPFEQALLLRRA
jgi:deazaflavin-dependent oxidoreductase (nitroreductase family)